MSLQHFHCPVFRSCAPVYFSYHVTSCFTIRFNYILVSLRLSETSLCCWPSNSQYQAKLQQWYTPVNYLSIVICPLQVKTFDSKYSHAKRTLGVPKSLIAKSYSLMILIFFSRRRRHCSECACLSSVVGALLLFSFVYLFATVLESSLQALYCKYSLLVYNPSGELRTVKWCLKIKSLLLCPSWNSCYRRRSRGRRSVGF